MKYKPNAEFDAWVASLPAKHWAKYDLSACRLGWEAANALKADKIEPPRYSHSADGKVVTLLNPEVIHKAVATAQAAQVDEHGKCFVDGLGWVVQCSRATEYASLLIATAEPVAQGEDDEQLGRDDVTLRLIDAIEERDHLRSVLATQPHSPDAAYSGRVTSAMVRVATDAANQVGAFSCTGTIREVAVRAAITAALAAQPQSAEVPPCGVLHALDQADTALGLAGLGDNDIFRIELKQAREVVAAMLATQPQSAADSGRLPQKKKTPPLYPDEPRAAQYNETIYNNGWNDCVDAWVAALAATTEGEK